MLSLSSNHDLNVSLIEATFSYSDNKKTMEKEDAITAIRKCILCGYKANSFTRYLLNH